jgi:mannose-6-phosphate isomerase-like protein (cupin superfamily)
MNGGYTRVNLRDDVEDQAAKHGMGEILEAHFAANDLEMEKSAVSFQAIKPGKRLPFGHNHTEQEELYVVIRGGGRIKLDDDVVELSELDAVRISPETMRAVEAGDEGIELIAIGAPKKEDVRADVGRQEMGWWSD